MSQRVLNTFKGVGTFFKLFSRKVPIYTPMRVPVTESIPCLLGKRRSLFNWIISMISRPHLSSKYS